jgi:cyclomaltodextrinase
VTDTLGLEAQERWDLRESEVLGPGVGKRRARKGPDWLKKAIVIEIFPRAFSPEGTLEGIRQRLRDLASVGVDALCLMPIHPIGRKGRKGSCGSPYAVRNHFEIHPELGSKEDLRRLIADAHRLRLRVILDFIATRAANDHVELAVHRDWYVRDEKGEPVREIPGWTDVVCLDLGNPEVREYLLSAMLYWVREFDVDGFRCEAAGRAPLGFWEEARRLLDAERRDLCLLAEWSDPGLHLSAFDATYDWRFHRTLLDVRAGRQPASAVVEGLAAEERRFPRGAVRLRFLESHDEKRAADAFGLDALEAYVTLLFTVGGVPVLYNGQLEGDDVRPSLFEKHVVAQEPLNPFVPKLYRRLIRLRKENPVFANGRLIPLPNSLPRYVVSFARFARRQVAVVVVNLRDRKSEVIVEFPESVRRGREDWLFADLGWQKLRMFRKPQLFLEVGPYEACAYVGEPEGGT